MEGHGKDVREVALAEERGVGGGGVIPRGRGAQGVASDFPRQGKMRRA